LEIETNRHIFLLSFIAKMESKQIVPSESSSLFGTLPLIQSTERSGRIFSRVKDLESNLAGKEVLVRARLHNLRAKGF
jgi:hypothetical protein